LLLDRPNALAPAAAGAAVPVEALLLYVEYAFFNADGSSAVGFERRTCLSRTVSRPLSPI
jgi:hypothetical protein